MKRSITIITAIIIPLLSQSQPQADTLRLSLTEVIAIAKEKSTAAVQATTIRENQYWQYKTFKANYNPQLGLDGSLPQFSKTNIPVIQPEGTVEFKPVTNDNSQLNLGITQNIGATGGQLFIGSNMLRFRDFDLKAVRKNLSCDPHQKSNLPPSVTVDALLPVGYVLPGSDKHKKKEKDPVPPPPEQQEQPAQPEQQTQSAPQEQSAQPQAPSQ